MLWTWLRSYTGMSGHVTAVMVHLRKSSSHFKQGTERLVSWGMAAHGRDTVSNLGCSSSKHRVAFACFDGAGWGGRLTAQEAARGGGGSWGVGPI